jgi:hypothetical protein
MIDNEIDKTREAQMEIAEHIKRFGTSAKGKTESFDQLAKQFADRMLGLGWKVAWALRLEALGHKTRLPRGFIRVINYVHRKGL